MAERPGETANNIVFVDTSLDTHLVMVISPCDTASDFKKMILLQHSQCFPRIGEIKIHSLQVKRQGRFYHLPDSMLVCSAFNGSKRTWFLFVDASHSQEDDKEQLSHKPDASETVTLIYLQNHSQGNQHNLLPDDPLNLANEKVPQAVQASPRNFCGQISRDIEMEVGHLQDDCQKELSSDINEKLGLAATLEENTRVSENAPCSDYDNSRDNNKTTVDSSLNELPSAANKRKIEHIESIGLSVKKKRKIEKKKDPLVDASGKVPSDMQTRQTDVRGELYDTLSSDTNWMSISGAQKKSLSESTAEQSDKLGRKEVYVDRSNSTNGEHVSKQETVPSLQEVEDHLATGVSSEKGKKKQKKTSFVPHDQAATSDSNPVLHGSVFHANMSSETPEPNKNEGHVELALNNDPEGMLSEGCKPLDQVEADGTNEESVPSPNFLVANIAAGAVDSHGTKRNKRRTKKKAPGIETYSIGVETNTAGAISSTVPDLPPKVHINDRMENDESMLSLNQSDQNNRIEKERGFPPNHDPQTQLSESFKPSDQVEAQEINKGSIGSILSPNLSDANEAEEAGNSGSIKRKKRNVKKSAAKVQDKSDIENLCGTSVPAQDVILNIQMNDETTKKTKISVPHTEIELNNKLEEGKELSFEHRPEVILAKGNKSLDSGEETMKDKESGFAEMSLDNLDRLEAGKFGGSRKKKRVKKHPITNDDFSSMEHANPVSAPATDGDRGLSFKHGTEMISSKGSRPLDLGEVPVNVNESGFAAQLLENEADLKAGKSGGHQKKRRAKKHASSVCDSPAKNFASEPQGNQSMLSCNEGKETSKVESRNATNSGASKGNEAGKNNEIVSPLAETDQTWENAKNLDENLREAKNDQRMDSGALQDQPVELQANEVQPLSDYQADGKQENAGNIKKKEKKKARRNQNTAAETHGNSKTKGQSIGIEELATSGDKLGDVGHPYDTMNISSSAKTRTPNQSAVSELMLEQNAGVKSKISNPEPALKGADSSEVPSYHTLENNPEWRPETMTHIENIAETSKAGDEGINFRHYFLPGEPQSEVASADQVKEALHATEAKRKAKKPNVVSEGTLRSNQQSQNRSNTNDNQLEESSPDAKRKEDMSSTKKETSKSSGNVVKASNAHDVRKVKTPWKAKEPVVANGPGSSRTTPSWLEENNGSMTSSSSSFSSKGSKRVLRDTSNTKRQSGFTNDGSSARKFSTKNDGDVVNSSQQGKSLLTAPGAIFSDGSSGSSGDENGIENSDASTHTPSDSSSSSGYSVGESELSQNSKGNGSENAKRIDCGRKSTLNSKFPGLKDLSMDMILRSSKRFKKAKLTASQSQGEDMESQPVDFVPDSQAN